MRVAEIKNQFETIDHQIEKLAIHPKRSLCPTREQAKPFTALAQHFFNADLPPTIISQAAICWQQIIKSLLNAFPENLFWDFDYMMYCFLREVSATNDQEAYIRRYQKQITGLMETFGKDSNIKFRYIHDFTYGFDWAKWVKKAPAQRKYYGPFSTEFLTYLYNRGQELELLIAADDRKYHKLPGNQKFRNPFVFSREPEDESRLMQLLYDKNLIPVKTWVFSENANWDKPYAELRKKVSKELGLQKQ